MRSPVLVLLVMFAFLTSGCLSAAISRAAGRGRDVLQSGTSREAVVQHFGKPADTLPEWIETKAKREAQGSASWTVWKVRGRPAQVDDGGGQATVSALTLGVGEVLLLPMTLIEEGGNAAKAYYLLVIFDPAGKLLRYRSFEA